MSDAEEPTHKRRKVESRSEDNDEPKNKYKDKNTILENQNNMHTTCQSPDYDCFDNVNQHKIKGNFILIKLLIS